MLNRYVSYHTLIHAGAIVNTGMLMMAAESEFRYDYQMISEQVLKIFHQFTHDALRGDPENTGIKMLMVAAESEYRIQFRNPESGFKIGMESLDTGPIPTQINTVRTMLKNLHCR